MSLVVALAILGQHHVYHFRTLGPAPGQVVHAQAAAPPSPMTDANPTDPYGFTTWLNRTRAMHGLAPLHYDHNLSLWASRNNMAQRERGLGHHVMGPARRQAAAVITGDISPYVGSAWMNSDEHRPALLSPNVSRFGIAWDGMYFTWNAR